MTTLVVGLASSQKNSITSDFRRRRLRRTGAGRAARRRSNSAIASGKMHHCGRLLVSLATLIARNSPRAIQPRTLWIPTLYRRATWLGVTPWSARTGHLAFTRVGDGLSLFARGLGQSQQSA